MLKNYIKIAWRNLFNHKIDSAISIGGLAVGIACCILLAAYVRFEWSYDQFHQNGDRLYRVVETETNPRTEEVRHGAISPHLLAERLEEQLPEIASAIKVGGAMVQVEQEGTFRTERSLVAGPEFFQMFTFPLRQGDPSQALASRQNVVLTESKARELFGTTDVVGNSLPVVIQDTEHAFTVSAVAENPPRNSSLEFGMVIPFEAIPRDFPAGQRAWASGWGETWLLLNENADVRTLAQKLPAFVTDNYGAVGEQFKTELRLQPVDEIYFSQEVSSMLPQSNPLYPLVLGVIALVVLAIAGINFVSLTLGRAATRDREIGIRKVVGADRGQLARQFLGEVFLTCCLSLLAALLLAELLLPFFQQMVQQQVTMNFLQDPGLLLLVGGVLLLATLLTGVYPALVLSGRSIASIFRKSTGGGRTSPLVRSLIVVQFAMTISFIAVTVLMQKQLHYMTNTDLGYEPEGVVRLEAGGLGNAERGAEIYRRFHEEARRIPGVEAVSGTSGLFENMEELDGFTSGIFGVSTEAYSGVIHGEVADEHYMETMGIELEAGRAFSRERPAELKNGMIVNKRLVEEMGWEQPIGQTIDDKWGNFEGMQVIGVMENYHTMNLYNQIEPVAYMHRENQSEYPVYSILVRINTATVSSTLGRLEELWTEVAPDENFSYTFLEDYVRRQYAEEQRWGTIMKASSGASILLACFGLFGLAALAARRRTKEIGIRKVLGATVSNIVTLLSKDFIKLVTIGFVIAVPVAYYAMDWWLADFAYKIEIGAGVFALAGGAALLIALLTVSWQSIRAALANPVESLRSE
ncbi:MAG: ABC transporter permease [Balneolaceae bacterium]|nr:ABC transporter permease [Balneolaceae bacterium]